MEQHGATFQPGKGSHTFQRRRTHGGWHMPQVDRLFDLHHASNLDQIEAAAKVLGRHVEISVA